MSLCSNTGLKNCDNIPLAENYSFCHWPFKMPYRSSLLILGVCVDLISFHSYILNAQNDFACCFLNIYTHGTAVVSGKS